MSNHRPHAQSHNQSLSFDCHQPDYPPHHQYKNNEIYLATKAKLQMLQSKKLINSYRKNQSQPQRSPLRERRKKDDFQDYNAVLRNLKKMKKMDYLKKKLAKHQP